MRVFSIRESTWVNAGLDLAWRRIVTLEEWPEWNPAIREASWRGKPGWKEGHRFRLSYPGKTRPFLGGGKILLVEPLATLRWTDHFFTMRVEYTLDLAPQGRGTGVDFASQFTGFATRFFSTDSFVRWLTHFQREFLANFREACESVTGDWRDS